VVPELIRINAFRSIQPHDCYAVGRLIPFVSPPIKKELSMIVSNMGPVPVVPTELPQKKDIIADGLGPMSEQDVTGSHGHEMYPQKLVRLIGCHDVSAAKHDAAYH
jgi:hypothetical protein